MAEKIDAGSLEAVQRVLHAPIMRLWDAMHPPNGSLAPDVVPLHLDLEFWTPQRYVCVVFYAYGVNVVCLCGECVVCVGRGGWVGLGGVRGVSVDTHARTLTQQASTHNNPPPSTTIHHHHHHHTHQ